MTYMSDLKALAPLLGRTMVLVAHPDDECITCGGLLQKMRNPLVIFATDGAPEDPYFWGKHGSRSAYAALRQQEARNALAQVGVTQVEFLADYAIPGVSFIDQQLYRVIPAAREVLRATVKRHRPEAILTLAYEGGHPDHDACSLIGTLLGLEADVPVWEAPLYHRNPDKSGAYQQFVQESGDVVELSVTGDMLIRKKQMLGSYKSQFQSLPHFRPQLERFRGQFGYDYTQPPHEGLLNYEIWEWKMTGREVSRAFAAVLADSRCASAQQS
jgi:N-acetylglucosamine malate deacetylase 2